GASSARRASPQSVARREARIDGAREFVERADDRAQSLAFAEAGDAAEERREADAHHQAEIEVLLGGDDLVVEAAVGLVDHRVDQALPHFRARRPAPRGAPLPPPPPPPPPAR